MCNRRVMFFLAVALTTTFLLNEAINSKAAPIPPSESHKTKALELLEKQLPKLINRWLREESDLWAKDAGVEIKLVRPISKIEVKMTIAYKTCLRTAIEGYHIDDALLLTLYLRYYDSHWTVSSFYSNEKRCDVARLILLIDEAAGKMAKR